MVCGGMNSRLNVPFQVLVSPIWPCLAPFVGTLELPGLNVLHGHAAAPCHQRAELLPCLDACPRIGLHALLCVPERRRLEPYFLHPRPPPCCDREHHVFLRLQFDRLWHHHVLVELQLDRLGSSDEPRRRVFLEADGTLGMNPERACVGWLATVVQAIGGRQERMGPKVAHEEAIIHCLRRSQLATTAVEGMSGEAKMGS